jgi:hypothetical protein
MVSAGMEPAPITRDDPMTQYLLSIYQPDGSTPPPDALQKVMKEVNALATEMKSAGVWVFSGGLHPAETATVVRLKDSKVMTTDGPYTEGKEHVGGFTVITAEDLDAALAWAGKLAAALSLDGRSSLAVEVRPFQH